MNSSVRCSKRLGVYGIFLFASVFYISGLNPTIAWRDASEFVTVAHSLGISHPAGSPAYSLLAKLTTFIPLGNIALRINLFSALMGALAVALLFSLLYDLLSDTTPFNRLCAALSGALFLLFSASFWRFAEVAEVYSLQDVLLILLISIIIKARHVHPSSPSMSIKLFWVFAYLYGLSAGVHVTMALFAPAFLISIWLIEARMFKGKEFAFLAFFFLLGFAVYLYLPIRSLSNPVYDWGDPQTFRQFWLHLMDRKDAPLHIVLTWHRYPYQLRVYLENLSNQFSTYGILLGFFGYLCLLWKDKFLCLLFSLVFLGNVVFFGRSWTAAFGFIPSFIIFSIWIAFGINACLNGLTHLYQKYQIRIPRFAINFCLIGGVVVTLGGLGVRHLPIAYQTNNYSAELYGKELLQQLPTDSILFSSYSWFPLLYLQHVERRRPDLSILLQGDVIAPEYYGYISKDRFPNIRVSNSDEPVVMSTGDYFWLLAQINYDDHPLFWDPDPVHAKSIESNLTPNGLLYRFDPFHKTEITSQLMKNHREILTASINRILQGNQDKEAIDLLAGKTYFFGRYYNRQMQLDEAAKMYRLGLTIHPDDPYLLNTYGNYLISQKQYQQALEKFKSAYLARPIHASANKNLGTLFLRWGKYEKAVYFLKRAISFGPPSPDVHTFLGEAYIRLGQYKNATQALRSALSLYKERAASDSPPESAVRLSKKTNWVEQSLHYLEIGTVELLNPLAKMWDQLPEPSKEISNN